MVAAFSASGLEQDGGVARRHSLYYALRRYVHDTWRKRRLLTGVKKKTRLVQTKPTPLRGSTLCSNAYIAERNSSSETGAGTRRIQVETLTKRGDV